MAASEGCSPASVGNFFNYYNGTKSLKQAVGLGRKKKATVTQDLRSTNVSLRDRFKTS